MAEPDATTIARETARLAAAQVHVSYPATVVSYDSASQKATVRIVPCFRRKDPAQDNAVVTYRPPDLPGIPVAFPGAGAFSMTWPLAAGDSGLLIVTSRSMDEWKANGGPTSEPEDQRRHDLTDSVFLPGLRSFTTAERIPAAGVDDDALVLRAPMTLVGDSTASAFVALANLVKTELESIRADVAAHTHPIVVTSVDGDTATSSPPVGFNTTAGSVAATRLKSL